MFNKDSILTAIPASIEPKIEQIFVFDQLGSTSDFLMEHEIATSRACVCVADRQLKGRGRRGNQWQSDEGRNLTMSISWGFPSWPETITGLSLATGMTIASRLASQHDLDIKLKWPNDLYLQGAKLGGVLVDMKGHPGGVCQVVIGIGINLEQPNRADSSSDYRWTSFAAHGIDIKRGQLAALLIGDLVEMLVGFDSVGFEPLISSWNDMCAYANQKIKVQLGGTTIIGVIAGVDRFGALQVKDEHDQIQSVADSTARVRLLSSI